MFYAEILLAHLFDFLFKENYIHLFFAPLQFHQWNSHSNLLIADASTDIAVLI